MSNSNIEALSITAEEFASWLAMPVNEFLEEYAGDTMIPHTLTPAPRWHRGAAYEWAIEYWRNTRTATGDLMIRLSSKLMTAPRAEVAALTRLIEDIRKQALNAIDNEHKLWRAAESEGYHPEVKIYD